MRTRSALPQVRCPPIHSETKKVPSVAGSVKVVSQRTTRRCTVAPGAFLAARESRVSVQRLPKVTLGRSGPCDSRARGKGWRALARPAVALVTEEGPPPARQNFPPNLPTNRRLCSTVGGRFVEGWTAHCCAVSAARSRAATMTNLARSSLAWVLSALFGAAKSCALVNLFMICPRLSVVASRQRPDSTSDHGHLMASVHTVSRGRQIVRAADDIHCTVCRDRARCARRSESRLFGNRG